MGKLGLVCKLGVMVSTSAAVTLTAAAGLADTVTGCNAAISINLGGPSLGCSMPETAPEQAAETIAGASSALGSAGVLFEYDDSAHTALSDPGSESGFAPLAEASTAASDSGSLTLVALGVLLLGAAALARQARAGARKRAE